MNPYVDRLRMTLLPVAFVFGIGAFGLPHALPARDGLLQAHVTPVATPR